MEYCDYSLSTNHECYINNNSAHGYFTINKDMEGITMIYTKYINNDIEDFLNKNNINDVYDRGFKKYTYEFNNQKFEFFIQSKSDGLMIVLKNI